MSAESERLKGNQQLIQKNYKEAIIHFTSALEILEEVSTYSNRAMAYFKLNNFNACISDASKAIDLDPKFIKAYHRRGNAYLQLKTYDLAIIDYEHIISTSGGDAEVISNLKEC